ncbi:MAG: hypothetical protein ACOVQA_05830 [Thermoflexibacteraceae bacterium]|jgi:hypothetical protein
METIIGLLLFFVLFAVFGSKKDNNNDNNNKSEIRQGEGTAVAAASMIG